MTNTAINGQHRVKPGEIFVSELFKQAGYTTGLFGKWHLHPDPQSKGFDHVAPTSWSKHFRLVNNTELYDHRTDPGEQINVIEQHPELVAKMREFYENWWDKCLPNMINEKGYPFR